MNCIDQPLLGVLPPTDARLRPDTRLLEQGLFSQVRCLSTLCYVRQQSIL